MQTTLNKISQLVQELNSLQPIKQEYQQKLEKKFRLEFNYNSNHLEGNTLTYNETELLLIFDDTKGNHNLREYEEMKAHDVAYQLISDWAKDKEHPLTEAYIKNLNEIILVRPYWKDAITPNGQNTRRLIKVGDYKEHSNSVRLKNGELFEYASPADTPILMNELIQWYRTEADKNELNPVALAALLHYKFVRIHPFDDGNGRVSRLLMNYVLLKNNLPPIIIKSVDKANYLSSLNRADTGDLDSFVEYIGQQLIWSLELTIKVAKGGSENEPGDLDKKIKILKQKLNSGDIKLEKNKESTLDVLDKNIFPLLKNISNKLKEFDSLFKAKKEILSFSSKEYSFPTAPNILKEFIKAGHSFIYLTYTYELNSFRQKNNNSTFRIDLQIIFHQLVYELKTPDNSFSLNKLYHEFLTDDETKMIVESLGTSFYNQIEKALNKV